LGATDGVAAEVARHLVNAELSGHASHGVLRLSQYADEIAAGVIDPGATPERVPAAGQVLLIDAKRGFGHAAAALAVQAVLEAADSGPVLATIRNCTHIGRLGEYSERLAASGLLSCVAVGAAGPGVGVMAAFGSRSGEAFLNTNPWAMAFPAEGGAVVFDAAMSTIAEGKVLAAAASGGQLPAGCVLDSSGRPSTDPADYAADGTLTPLGGALAGHKGYGLALAAALLGGLAHADGSVPELGGLARIRRPELAQESLGGVAVWAMRPPGAGYARAVGSLTAALRADGVLVPGDLERRHRERNGDTVRLPGATLDALARLEAGLAAPESGAALGVQSVRPQDGRVGQAGCPSASDVAASGLQGRGAPSDRPSRIMP
jgi:LDH2 family malate/lactate/ureidoglycolate dehydrogenase